MDGLLYGAFVVAMVLIAGACTLVGFIAHSGSETKTNPDITEGNTP